MTNIASDYIHRGSGGRNRRPVLAVIILLLVALGVAVLAVWLGTGNGQNPRKSDLLYVVGIATAEHNREAPWVNYS